VTTDVLRRWSPWSPADALRWIAVGLVGYVVAALGWWFASREAALDDQVGFAALGVGGCALVAYANITWLLQGRFAIVQRHRQLLSDVIAPVSKPFDHADADDDGVVAGPGLALFHRPDCVLVAGRGWPVLDGADGPRDGRVPCGICRP
jgi:hypothetical protein